MSTQCIVKKLYNKFTPYIQMGGFITLMCTLLTGLWMVYGFIAQGNASASTLMDYQEFKTETKVRLAEMAQEIHDIHGWVKPKRTR